MRGRDVPWRSFDKAVQGILQYFVENQRDTRVLYFDGWRGFGASAVLRAVADELTSERAPRELQLDKVIHIDCSLWKSRREMQRTIAVELKIDDSAMEAFDKADEEDDFLGLDEGSRGEIMSVGEAIHRALIDHRFIVVFHNGSGEDMDLASFGVPPIIMFRANLLWTFGRRFQASELYWDIKNKMKNTQLFAYESEYDIIKNKMFFKVLRKEASTIVAKYPCMREITPERIVQCFLYGLFLYLCYPNHMDRDRWPAQASTYCVCDGIIEGDQAWNDISDALSKEIKWYLKPGLLDEVRGHLIESSSDNPVCFQRFRETYFDENQMTHPQIAMATSKDMPAISTDISSFFLAPKTTHVPLVLADGLLNQSTNLHVLHLSYCSFSFASPPFIACQNLRYLGLFHCKDRQTSKQNDPRKWQFLVTLWVLDLIYTDWYQVFAKDIADLLVNLRELNIEGVQCSQYIGQFLGQLPNLHKLRIVKPTEQPNSSTDPVMYFINNTKLEILDLSGNTNMESVPFNSSKATSLQVLVLDGCNGLGNVVSDGLPPSLKSFSFDGYGPAASKWATTDELPTRNLRPSSANVEKHIKTSLISLKGCTLLKNLFLRLLPNLVELDLSGTAIKILDFTTMVVEVSGLKRLFLLGCEQLRAIKWDGEGSEMKPCLELLCVDTRPGIKCPRPSVSGSKSFRLQVHAVIVDARLARSLWTPIDRESSYDVVSFSIHVTSSTADGGVIRSEETYKDEIDQPNDQVNLQHPHLVSTCHYRDVLSMVGDAPMRSFPQPPATTSSRCHIEIAEGSHSLESELDRNSEFRSLALLAAMVAESLHVHDASTSASMPGGNWNRLRWLRIERCPNMETVFPRDAGGFTKPETIWVSDLLMAHRIWSKGSRVYTYSFQNSFEKLRHLHLRCCPSIHFVLPVWVSAFPSLETLHVIHCTNLRNVFVLNEEYPTGIAVDGVGFPKLTSIHLHDLPALQQIGEFKMVAPALETIKIRGCWSLRRLPAVAAGGGPKPAVDIEKEVWNALEWDGVEAGHHPSLFQPQHSRYYKKKLPRVSVLR